MVWLLRSALMVLGRLLTFGPVDRAGCRDSTRSLGVITHGTSRSHHVASSCSELFARQPLLLFAALLCDSNDVHLSKSSSSQWIRATQHPDASEQIRLRAPRFWLT